MDWIYLSAPCGTVLPTQCKLRFIPKNIWERIHRGGYPELQDPDVDWGIYFSSYVKTYLESDVRKLSAVQNLNDFRRFMVAVAARTGQMVNYSNIADEIGKDQTTVKAWMSILEASGIIYLLEPYTVFYKHNFLIFTKS